jgi:hypothetical protein
VTGSFAGSCATTLTVIAAKAANVTRISARLVTEGSKPHGSTRFYATLLQIR